MAWRPRSAVAEMRHFDLCTAVRRGVVLGPLTITSGRLLATVQIDSFDAAGLAELQGLDLRMDCREEQRCDELHGAATGDLWGRGIDAMVQWAAVLREQCVKVQLQQLII